MTIQHLFTEDVAEAIWYGENRFGYIVYEFIGGTDFTLTGRLQEARRVREENTGYYYEVVYDSVSVDQDKYRPGSIQSASILEPSVMDEARYVVAKAEWEG